MSVYPPFQLLNQLTDFSQTLYGSHSIGGHLNVVVLNYLQLVVTAQQIHKLVRYVTPWWPWDDRSSY